MVGSGCRDRGELDHRLPLERARRTNHPSCDGSFAGALDVHRGRVAKADVRSMLPGVHTRKSDRRASPGREHRPFYAERPRSKYLAGAADAPADRLPARNAGAGFPFITGGIVRRLPPALLPRSRTAETSGSSKNYDRSHNCRAVTSRYRPERIRNAVRGASHDRETYHLCRRCP